jgi:hypothetical protein
MGMCVEKMTLKNDCVFKVKYGVEKCPSNVKF